MQKVHKSNKSIKQEVAQIKQNSLIEINTKFAEMTEKNKKEQSSSSCSSCFCEIQSDAEV